MRLLPILGILAISANLQAQPQAAVNRQPVSDGEAFLRQVLIWTLLGWQIL